MDAARVRTGTGEFKTLDNRTPIPRPSGAEKNCRFCVGRYSCHRDFYVEDKQDSICGYYKDMETPEEAARLKELSKILVPVPRKEGAPRDCLNCCRLALSGRCRPRQGSGKVCYKYYETTPRKPDDPKICQNCFNNWGCQSKRIEKGTICDLYGDFVMV